MKNQKGFTAVELVMVVAFFAAIGIAIGAGYALIHFIAKFW